MARNMLRNMKRYNKQVHQVVNKKSKDMRLFSVSQETHFKCMLKLQEDSIFSSCVSNLYRAMDHTPLLVHGPHMENKGRFTHSLPFLCHAVPLRVQNVCFQFDLHSAAVSDSHLPCHALTMQFLSRPRHSTAVEGRPVSYLPAFGFLRLPCVITRRLLSDAQQSSSQRSIPATVKIGSSTLQKKTIC